MNRDRIAAGLCLVFSVAALEANEKKLPVVEVAQPVERAITDFEQLTARLEAAQRVDLRARVSGFLGKIHFKAGAMVKQGDLLFEIDDKPGRAALEGAEAQLQRADAQVAQAKADFERATRLREAKSISQEEHDRTKAKFAETRAMFVAAVAEHAKARLQVEFARITAPFDGRIGPAQIDAGNLVKADETLLARVDAVDRVYAYFHVDERTLLRVRKLMQPDKDAVIPVWMGAAGDVGYPHRGQLDFADNRVDPKADGILCRAVFANPEGRFLPGGRAVVRIATSAPSKVLAIDERATWLSAPGTVWVVNGKNVVESRKVELDWRDELGVIEKGLDVNDQIIVKGVPGIKAGMKVQPKRVPMLLPATATREPPEPRPAKLKELLKERHVLLSKVADLTAEQYRAGRGSLDAVAQAQRAVLEAGLDLAGTRAERLALLRQNVEQAEAMHKAVEARARAGVGSAVEEIQARAQILDARIRLLREETR